jgi:hypothetical protein
MQRGCKTKKAMTAQAEAAEGINVAGSARTAHRTQRRGA